MVLEEQQTLGLFDNVSEVLEEDLALRGEIAVGLPQPLVVGERGECDIDLLVRGELAGSEG